MNFYRSLVYIFVAAVIVPAMSIPAVAQTKTPAEYWAETTLEFNLVREVINQENCMSDVQVFIACVQAVNTLAAELKPKQSLIGPGQLSARADLYGSVHDQYGPLQLVELRERDTDRRMTVIEIWERESSVKELELAALTEIFETRTDSEKLDFERILRDLEQKAVPQEKEAELAAGVINKYLQSAVDPHTYIVPIAQIDDQRSATNTSFHGVGMFMAELGGEIILTPMEDQAAIRAGIREQDILYKVDGERTSKMSLAEIIEKVRGPEGTPVTIGVLRNGEEVEIPIVRAPVVIENLQYKMIRGTDADFGYIKLASFVEGGVCGRMADAIRELETQGAKGLILDLRNNGGGLLNEGRCIGGLFLGRDQVVVQVQDLQSAEMTPLLTTSEKVTDLPMVTLLNAQSASASELVAGALQDHRRSWVAGIRSFGKGSVQRPRQFLLDVLMYSTTQQFYQPSGRTNQAVGITPDFEIPVRPDATPEEMFAQREEDLYSNALPADATPWQQPRPREAQAIESCAATEGVADSEYEAGATQAIRGDYQLLASQDMLACALKVTEPQLH